jgi:hypothetical protein
VLFVFDTYSWEFWQSQGVSEETLRVITADQDLSFRLEILSTETQLQDVVNPLLTSLQPRAVYLDISSRLSPDLLRSFPEILFLLRESSGLTADNLIQIEYDKQEVWFQAGQEAGLLINSPDLLKTFDLLTQVGKDPKVGILIGHSNSTVAGQVDAFRRGFLTQAEGDRLVYKEIGNINDRAKARRLMEQMKEEYVVITMLKTYTLNSFCLEYFRNEGGLAVVEDWWGGSRYQHVVLLSIQEDLSQTLRDVLVKIAVDQLPAQGRFAGHSRLVSFHGGIESLTEEKP